MQLVIKTPETAFPQLIEFNFEELKNELTLSLEKYRGLAYTAEAVKEAKTDRAALNKLKSAIEDARKRQKAICLKPYNEFETKIKELTGLIDKPILEIDSQIKKFDEAKKAEKLDAITKFYEAEAQQLLSLVPFEKILNPRWLNVTVSMAAIEKEIKDIVAKITNELATIDEFGGELTIHCKDVYLKTLDLSAALHEKKRVEELKARLEEEKRKAEEAAKAEAKEAQAEINAQPAPAQIEPQPAPAQEETEKTYSLSFRVVATAQQLRALRKFLDEQGIHFEKI